MDPTLHPLFPSPAPVPDPAADDEASSVTAALDALTEEVAELERQLDVQGRQLTRVEAMLRGFLDTRGAVPAQGVAPQSEARTPVATGPASAEPTRPSRSEDRLVQDRRAALWDAGRDVGPEHSTGS